MAYEMDAINAPRLASWPRHISLWRRVGVFVTALVELAWLDLCALVGFQRLRTAVERTRAAPVTSPHDPLTLVRVAVRDACIFYPKPVHCLQRSAVVTRMLRRRGVPAQLIIGCQPMPLKGHAWVELNNAVIWDGRPYLATYRVLDRL